MSYLDRFLESGLYAPTEKHLLEWVCKIEGVQSASLNENIASHSFTLGVVINNPKAKELVRKAVSLCKPAGVAVEYAWVEAYEVEEVVF